MIISIRKIGLPLLIGFFALNIVGAGVAYAQTEVEGCNTRSDISAAEVDALTGGKRTTQIDAGTHLELNTAQGGDNSLLCTFSLIKFLANILFFVVGAVAVLLLFYAAFLYVTAGANTANTTRAKQVLMYAIIGLLLAAVARIIPTMAQGLFLG